ncbi:unnamed protein product [Calicophoron daubneyi]|uniref:Cystatin domain-containing protein n=1 Tax=Calicophoron daubneyi TaxID=300641 RepID=A0AAV2T726_CALDB
MMCGGCSPEDTPSAEEKTKIEKLLQQKLCTQLGRQPSMMKIISLTRQVVAGTNYFVKVQIGENDFIHARIFEALPCYGGQLELHSIEQNKKANDPINYF